MADKKKYIRWLKDITIDDGAYVGGKNASLGEMYRELATCGVKIPNGFAVTAKAYWDMVNDGGILPEMEKILEGLDKTDLDDFSERGHRLRELVYRTPLPADVETEIIDAYRLLCEQYGDETDVA